MGLNPAVSDPSLSKGRTGLGWFLNSAGESLCPFWPEIKLIMSSVSDPHLLHDSYGCISSSQYSKVRPETLRCGCCMTVLNTINPFHKWLLIKLFQIWWCCLDFFLTLTWHTEVAFRIESHTVFFFLQCTIILGAGAAPCSWWLSSGLPCVSRDNAPSLGGGVSASYYFLLFSALSLVSPVSRFSFSYYLLPNSWRPTFYVHYVLVFYALTPPFR